jgi:hypothetical protein
MRAKTLSHATSLDSGGFHAGRFWREVWQRFTRDLDLSRAAMGSRESQFSRYEACISLSVRSKACSCARATGYACTG